MFKIEKGIPMPKAKGGRKHGSLNPNSTGQPPKYPFKQMKVGESFLAHDVSSITISHSLSNYGKRHNKKFSVRKVSGVSCRVFRVK